MAEEFVPNPDASDGTFVSKNILFDPHPEEAEAAPDTGAMGEFDKLYQQKIESLNPDDKFLEVEEVARLEATIQEGKRAAIRLESGSKRPVKATRESLLQQKEDGEAARDTLVVSHLRLAAWFVRLTMDFGKQQREAKGERGKSGRFTKELSALSGGDLEYGDRMQLASLGLLKAAEAHDPAKGSFTGYAMMSMEGELLREMALDQSPLKMGINRSGEVTRVKRAIDKLETEGVREPNNDQLAKELGQPAYHVAYLRDLMVSRQQVSFERVEEEVASALAREDAPGNVEQPVTLADMMPDAGVDRSVADEAALSELGYRLDQLMAELNEREQRIVELRFGLEDGEPRTLEEVAGEFGVTRERIRQIESKAMAILRHPKRSNRLRDFIGSFEDPTAGQRAEVVLSEGQNIALGIIPAHLRKDDSYEPKTSPEETREHETGRSYSLEQLAQLRAQREAEEQKRQEGGS